MVLLKLNYKSKYEESDTLIYDFTFVILVSYLIKEITLVGDLGWAFQTQIIERSTTQKQHIYEITLIISFGSGPKL